MSALVAATLATGLVVVPVDAEAAAEPAICVEPITAVTEGGPDKAEQVDTTQRILVTLSSAPPAGFRARLSAVESATPQARAGVDFVSSVVELSAGSFVQVGDRYEATHDVTIRNDNEPERDEKYLVHLTNVVGASTNDTDPSQLRCDQREATIKDQDDQVLTLEGPPNDVEEGNAARLTVRAQWPVFEDVLVAWAVTLDEGTESSDVVDESGVVVMRSGADSATFDVSTLDDVIDEPDETFTVALTVPARWSESNRVARGVPSSHTVTITDDDDTPTLTVHDLTVDETDASARAHAVRITLSGPTERTVSGTWSVTDGTATAPADYYQRRDVADYDSFSLAPLTMQTEVQVWVVGDRVSEPEEHFFIDVDSDDEAAAAADARTRATVTIRDNDAPGVGIRGAAVREGSSGFTYVAVPVVRLGGATGPLTFDYRTLGDATPGAAAATPGADAVACGTSPDCDYVTTSGKGVIPAGAWSTTVSVPIRGDTVEESDETFLVEITGASTPIEQGRSRAVVTIVDDDGVKVRIGDPDLPAPEVIEGDAGTSTLRIPVFLDGVPSGDVTVSYATAPGSASPRLHPSAAGDYDHTTGDLTFRQGGTPVQYVDVPIVGDVTDEPDETFRVMLSNARGGGATIARSEIQATILNDDATLSIADASVVEGTGENVPMRLTVSLAHPSARDVEVAYDLVDVTAVGGRDFVVPAEPARVLLIPANSASAEIVVDTVGDALDEEDRETFEVRLRDAAVGAAIADGTAIGTIFDDDAPPALDVSDVEVVEGDEGTTPAVFLVTLSAPSERAVSVGYGTVAGTATAFQDFTPAGGTLAFAPGETVREVSVAVVGDTVTEPDETFLLRLGGPSNARLADETGEGLIVDDDGPARLSVDDAQIVEGDTGTANLLFVVRRSGATGSAAPFSFATRDGTATGATSPAAPGDFQHVSGSSAVPPSQRTVSVVVPVRGDTLSEPHETLTLSITGADVEDGEGVGTILNDDARVRVEDGREAEGDEGLRPLELPLRLEYPSVRDVTVTYGVTPGTATADVDYLDRPPSERTVSIPAGVEAAAVHVMVIGDRVAEPDETFTVTIATSSPGASLARSTATGTILDDDAPTGGGTDGQSDGQADGATDGQSDGQADGGTDGQSDGGTDGQSDGQSDGGTDGQSDGVTDGGGPGGSTGSPGQNPGQSPTVYGGPDRLVESEESIAFVAIGEDPDRQPLTYRWDFGDGSPAQEGRDVLHTFARRGRYTVTVTATDPDRRTGTDEVVVTVRDTGIVHRSAGADRVATAVAASQDHWPDAASSRDQSSASSRPATTAVLARADDFADALAAGALVARLDAPLLLTPRDRLAPLVRAELGRLGVQRVVLLGGPAALSPEVETELQGAGYRVDRIAGRDRFESARLIALEAGASATGDVVLALGRHDDPNRAWPDALSAGALSSSPDRLPVLLTTATAVPAHTMQGLEALRAKRVLIVGGTAAIASDVDRRLRSAGYTTARLAGADRYGTSAAVAADALQRHRPGAVPVIMATGRAFADGLPAAAVAARLGGVVVLVHPEDLTRAAGVFEVIRSNAERFDVGRVIGGPAAVAERVAVQAREAMTAP